MACLLKLPSDGLRGVTTFTTQEWKLVQRDTRLLKQLRTLREKYLLGLHFNWHDYCFDPPTEFDFFMAGSDDLRAINDKQYVHIPMDACNFTPSAYDVRVPVSRFWDVLIAGSPVSFKRPEVALRTIRTLFDRSREPLHVLYLCPIPKFRRKDLSSAFYGIREYYEALFSAEERERFSLLTTEYDSPNPFSRETLAVFFRNSKVFLHCATDERRCRIAAYAWCAGVPVVAQSCVGSILTPDLRRPPAFWQVRSDNEYADAILDALRNGCAFDVGPYHKLLSETKTIEKLREWLEGMYADRGEIFSGEILSRNLDRRLGWHHQSLGGRANGLAQPLDLYMDIISKLSDAPGSRGSMLLNCQYPERVLADELNPANPAEAVRLERTSRYLRRGSTLRRKAASIFRPLGAKRG